MVLMLFLFVLIIIKNINLQSYIKFLNNEPLMIV